MFGRIKSAILRGGGDGTARTLSPSPPQQRGLRPASVGAPYSRPPGKQLIPVDSLHLNKVLGEGEFGVVQQAVWTTETGEKLQVAVKKLNRDKVNTGTQNFLKEVVIMQDIDHEHIVRMFGVVLDTDDSLMMVTELAPMRSLLECLKDPLLRIDFSVPRLCDFSQQVCDGMNYLENKRLVHRDLAARNILVFSKSQVKISDLGLSRILGAGQDYYQSKFSVSLKLPIAWCAPESINFLKFTIASDVWSFGVLLWEMFTYGFQPWAGFTGQQILEAIDAPNYQYLEQPDFCTSELYQLMKECWTHNPDDRPTFSSILLRLPQLRPTQVKALKDSVATEKNDLQYKAGDIIVVLDKSPATSSPPGLVWKGVLSNGRIGLFDPTNAVPFIEPKISPVAAKSVSLARKESSRKSARKIRPDMISRPQNDLRHTGHIGYDGAVFGDVSFIGDAYDKLPLRVEGGVGFNHGSSMSSIPRVQDSPDRLPVSSNSEEFLSEERNGYCQSWMSRESLNSQTTMHSVDGRCSPSYYKDVEDDSLFSDFKMPDLGTSFDFGPSFMDEVLKALDEKEKQVSSISNITPSATQNKNSEVELRFMAVEKPVPLPRENRTSSTSSASSVPPLPIQPPRVEAPKEKKQAKVKPMSASDERMVDNAIERARELTSYKMSDAPSPPVSPGEKNTFFEEEAHGLISRLKNSIKRSSPKSEHTRTFSDDLGNKNSVDDITPEAQQAYNMLVVKGSFKETSTDLHIVLHDSNKESSPSQTSKSSQEDSSSWHDIDKYNSSPPKHSIPPLAANTTQPIPLSNKPVISAPQLQSKPVCVTQPKSHLSSAPVPAPRPVKSESVKKSEIPVPKPRPEIQRVEPTVRQSVPASPDIPSKSERRIESHIPVSTSRDSKEKEREELKKTIEIVRMEDSSSLKEELSDKASFDRSSQRSSQRSSLEPPDNISENAESDQRADWDHSECSSDSSRLGRDSEPRTFPNSTSVERKDSFNKKQGSTLLFEEDLSEPSPQEIMLKLRERRLNRHMDHQKALTGEGEVSTVATTSRPRPSAREPQGIPGRSPSVDNEECATGEGGAEEVDTNPLRMLRGGAIPIRTAGRGTAGTSISGIPGSLTLRVPRLNFDSHLSRAEFVDQHHNANNNLQDYDHISQDNMVTNNGDSAAVEVTDRKLAIVDSQSFSILEPNNLLQTNTSVTELENHSLTVLLNSKSSYPVVENLSLKTAEIESSTPPPRPPPRHCQSVSDNHSCKLPLPGQLFDNSTISQSTNELPLLPPRHPQPGSTPLNSRPRERKYPLISPSSLQQNLDFQPPELPPSRKSTSSIPHSPVKHLPSVSAHNRQTSKPLPPLPLFSSCITSKSISKPAVKHSLSAPLGQPELRKGLSVHFGNSVDTCNSFYDLGLPPAYDFSDSCPDDSDCTADSEPTHMFLDPHHSPPVYGSFLEEPTHVPLSSLSFNKHSWTNAFMRPSPLTSRATFPTRVFERSLSSGHDVNSFTLLDNQSPPADLPPAPPTPSYREKLGLDFKRPKVSRSISHNPSHSTIQSSHLVGHCTSFPKYRVRSASDTSPLLTHSSSSSQNAFCSFLNNEVDDDDDAFFAEAPCYPHPYSQTPFHPIITNSTVTPLISPYHTSTTGTLKLVTESELLLSSRTSHKVSHSVRSKPNLHSNKHVAANSGFPMNLSDDISSKEVPTAPQKQHKSTKAAAAVFFKFPCVSASTSSNEATSPPTTAAHLPSNLDCSQPISPNDYSSSSDVSPLMFTSYSNASSASYEDLRQFALDRQKNCQEIETLLKLFPDQVTVEECLKALESTQWDVNKASKYLQLKRLFSLGLADVHKCKQVLAACGWNLQQAAESLLESCKTSASSQVTSSTSRLDMFHFPAASGSASPDILDV
ncbi:serine/arginine repetitive matrix protein 2 [Biomphalaria pfeifferi]|uniref:non-specific protein-tyrosine kinase n=1 Tax=Biomphalaria pfeifferi TaxID=112525 RepID=A0AAD8C154_BIOPF|nr:serine/arginine repetitive matrix protein 2 [Biomphalaria pfeifferi]